MENFEQHQDKCLGLLDLSCSNNTQCEHVDASICLPQGMRCACIPGYVPNHNRTTCITGLGLGGHCTSAALTIAAAAAAITFQK
ncbi:uncharacterized protein Dvir_GJ12389 [Drosophila virilis]|uniref:EGF-like domain-containing protein n=2 Tax=Drosophila virilis TaxID=7244 RepID=B4LRH2_DROVI|nr:uncharacterized protein Dvir_GJ12389 [Drosophila virilis]